MCENAQFGCRSNESMQSIKFENTRHLSILINWLHVRYCSNFNYESKTCKKCPFYRLNRTSFWFESVFTFLFILLADINRTKHCADSMLNVEKFLTGFIRRNNKIRIIILLFQTNKKSRYMVKLVDLFIDVTEQTIS